MQYTESHWIIPIRFKNNSFIDNSLIMTIIQLYAPTVVIKEEVDEFYYQIQSVIDRNASKKHKEANKLCINFCQSSGFFNESG